MNEKEKLEKDYSVINAIQDGDFRAFQDLLASGADPNVRMSPSGDPLVVALAHNGDYDWVKALLATGRCDVLQAGADGMLASHDPSVQMVKFGPSSQHYEP